jgi:DNA-binding NarL/FixJ family response regulator
MRLLVVDDHEIVFQGLQGLFKQDSAVQLELALEADSALTRLEQNPYHVVILDLQLSTTNSLELLKTLKERWPRQAVLIYTMFPEEVYAIRCMRLGADAYINKSSSPSELLKAVKQLANGHKYITPAVAERMAWLLNSGTKVPEVDDLSDREFQVLVMLASGLSVKEIAERLELSDKTISTYRARLLEKLNLQSNVDIVRFAIRNGLIY